MYLGVDDVRRVVESASLDDLNARESIRARVDGSTIARSAAHNVSATVGASA